MAVDPRSSEEQRLVAEYHIATEKYTVSVGELTQLRATMTKEDYTRLLNIVEDTHATLSLNCMNRRGTTRSRASLRLRRYVR
jgi:hypothetical protein